MPTCPSCGKPNPDDFRLCGFCGTPLAVRMGPGREERKTVSVLFVDLVGFTAQSDQADPEDVRATLRPYHGRVRKEIEHFGGTVEKFIGDAVMAVFGAPAAHEDDAERAVRAALRVHEAIRELNDANPRLRLRVRAAVNTGEAVVTLTARPEEGESIVTGDVVNTASRLQEVAPVGEVVVGEATYRSTRDVIDYEQVESARVKGKIQPLPVWLVRAAKSRYDVDLAGPLGPFVGRRGELNLLREAFARTVRESETQLLTVTGEPGVGKSRLIRELSTFLDQQPGIVGWRQGRCLPYGEGITFWGLGEIIKAQAGILESNSPQEAAARLAESVRALVAEPSEWDWLTARLAPLVGARTLDLVGMGERTESFAAWRRFLEAMASAGPLVLVFEDLHWADAAMVAFVDHLVEWSTGVPMLVICTARPDLYQRYPGWGGGKRNSTTIALSPLRDEEIVHLISALLSEAVLPTETQAALIERAGGNPLYAEEFIGMLTDRGILRRDGQVWRIPEDVRIPVPENVHGLIAARLDTLPLQRKALLQDAAVMGEVFWSGAVASMGGIGEQEALEGLHELSKMELVRPMRSSSVRDQVEFAFWHILIRDVSYGQIPRAVRVVKHRAAAEWIERLAGERVSDHAELLAHHYEHALDLCRAVGDVNGAQGLEAPTTRFLIMAGDRAMALDLAKAESLYRQALEHLPARDRHRGAVLAKVAQVAHLLARNRDSERYYREAIDEFRSQNDSLGLGDAMARLAFVVSTWGGVAGSDALLSEALDVLGREPPGPELAYAYVNRARSHDLAGRPREALEWAEKALALAERLEQAEHAVRARQFRGMARCDLGDLGGLEDLHAALQQGLEMGLGAETAQGYLNLAYWVWWTEGPAKGLEVDHAGIEFGRRRGLVDMAMVTTGETLWMLYDIGRWEELLRTADEVVTWAREHAKDQIGVIGQTYEALVRLWQGDLNKALSLGKEFLPWARRIGDRQILAPALAVAAVLEQARNQLTSAVRLVEELEGVTPTDSVHRAHHLPDVLRILTAAGEMRMAERIALAEADAPTARQRHVAITGKGIVAEARGETEAAAMLFQEAAERWADFGVPLERARSLLGAGRCFVKRGRQGEALVYLNEARSVFLGLGARRLLDKSSAWLARAAALTP